MMIKWIARPLITAAAASVIYGCSQNSAPTNQENPPPPVVDEDTGIQYKGPTAATAEVLAYQTEVWSNLAEIDRCGSCHIESGQAPEFARGDDIDLAYRAALTVVNSETPSLSRMVEKVSGGHQCWRGQSPEQLQACGSDIETWLNNWFNAAAVARGEELQQAQVLLLPPEEFKPVGASTPFPDNSAAFEEHLYTPYLQPYCSECHAPDGDTPQQPYFASSDVDAAYEAAKSKLKLSAPERSRMVVRLAEESHNCWTANCAQDAQDLTAAITAIANSIEPVEVNPALVTSNALNLAADGLLANTGGRIENNIIAKYEFKSGTGDIAFDTSGVDPTLDLRLSGDVDWLEGGVWGIRFFDNDGGVDPDAGRAQGATAQSEKLHRRISFTGEYSIEAWVAPANVTQEGPARIVSYSGGDEFRNFTLGQTLYNYDFLNRTSDTDLNGQPMLSTPNADEVLQATLQHVVVTFNVLEGRKIYVNGELIAQEEAEALGEASLESWDDTFALILGVETSGMYPWLGTMRFFGIHNRALGAESVLANYEAGVGEKFFMLFRVTESLADGAIPAGTDAYIVFEAEPFDSHSYLFANPFFYILDPNQLTGSTAAPLQDIQLKGMRIGLNGQEPTIGQAFANLDVTIDADSYTPGAGQPLSRLGALIPVEQGKDSDEFFLTFDALSASSFARPADPVPALPEPEDKDEAARVSNVGIKNFGEINASLSQMTGVPVTHAGVAETYTKVEQQLPVSENIEGFLPAHHMGITQLSVAYCSALIADTSLRAEKFPGFNFVAPAASAFDSTGRSLYIDRLAQLLVITTPTDDAVTSGPSSAQLNTQLNLLVERMTACGAGCSADTTTNTATAVCAAALGSAAMLVQ